jgi:methionyl-tRNA synthetase
VVYVWWDALANYVTALDYGSPAGHRPSEAYERWWLESDRRIHVIGKGILRFHAVYWPALLLSARQPLPTDIVVHPYLTVGGAKIAKSSANSVDPVDVAARWGTDALRWWFVRGVARAADTDFTEAKVVERYNQDLANGAGNLVSRVVSMVHKYRAGVVPQRMVDTAGAHAADRLVSTLPALVEAAIDVVDFRAATAAIVATIDGLNRLVEEARPWELARAERHGAGPDALDAVLASLVGGARVVAAALDPFVPATAAALGRQLGVGGGAGAALPAPTPVAPRLDYASSS